MLPKTKSELETIMVIIAIILSIVVGVLYSPPPEPQPMIDTAHEPPYLVKVKEGRDYIGWVQTIKNGEYKRKTVKGWTYDIAVSFKFSDTYSAQAEASASNGTVVIMRDEVRARERYLARR